MIFRQHVFYKKKREGLFGFSVQILFDFFILEIFSKLFHHQISQNTIFIESSRNTEVVFIFCRRIKGRE